MIYFCNDYSEGAHPRVLRALAETNLEATPGYGCDAYCERAREMIRARFACPGAAVEFLVGGTQANLTAATAFLRPWEALIAANTGHVAVHETGAIEAAGHKVYVVPGAAGKLTPESVRAAVNAHRDGTEEHMVLPRLVYVSDSTELGTIYTRAELQALSAVCRELGLYLYLDGARMGAALTARGNDLRPEDFAQLCDAFYIGGTKNGLLFGEAMVIVNPALQPFFRNVMKQRGGMLAKGRLLGVQFAALLADDLWLETARHANAEAARLTEALTALGVPFYAASPTNQIFPIFTDRQIEALRQRFVFEFTARVDETHCAVRFVTSWATRPEDTDALIVEVRALMA